MAAGCPQLPLILGRWPLGGAVEPLQPTARLLVAKIRPEMRTRPAALLCSSPSRAHQLPWRERIFNYFPSCVCLFRATHQVHSVFSVASVVCHLVTLLQKRSAISIWLWVTIPTMCIQVYMYQYRVWWCTGLFLTQGTGSQWVRLLISEHILWATSPARLWLHHFIFWGLIFLIQKLHCLQ